ncbi:MAG: hypothetical protein HYR63_13975 [Proteobacteria bacterium]|nr:hypothetical protein [Pseudomonadota bacterium]
MQGTSISLSAAATGGSVFVGWSGACSGSAGTIGVVVNADIACTATFAVGGKTLSVSLAGPGRGTVTSTPAGINCAPGSDQGCSAGFAGGTTVTLAARPAIGSGFVGWSGACAATGQVTAGVTLSTDVACTATFGPGTARPETGWWWNPGESGRGYSIEASDAGGSLHVYFGMYAYTESGAAVWYVATLLLAADGSAFSGTLLRYDGGTGLLDPYRPPADGRAVGKDGRAVQVVFATPGTGTIMLPPPDGVLPETSVAISRFAFVPGGLDTPRPTASGLPEAGWWWNSSRSGQGLFIEVQADSRDTGMVYLAVFHYRLNGAPVWQFGSTGVVQVGGAWYVLGMPLWECAGGPFLGAIGPRRFDCQAAAVGPVTMQFGTNGTQGVVSLNGVDLAIQRFSF